MILTIFNGLFYSSRSIEIDHHSLCIVFAFDCAMNSKMEMMTMMINDDDIGFFSRLLFLFNQLIIIANGGFRFLFPSCISLRSKFTVMVVNIDFAVESFILLFVFLHLALDGLVFFCSIAQYKFVFTFLYVLWTLLPFKMCSDAGFGVLAVR